jgi:hypothetical protein
MPTSPTRAAFTFALLAFASGCASTPNVASNLPLQRVVVYRNGIAYFERGGAVEEPEVRFKMKQQSVGDFLATLAVMEKGGSSVRAAAFPIPGPEEVAECDPDPLTTSRSHGDAALRLRPCTERERRKIREVVLQLDGKKHDLEVGYVTEAPVWRPSYRLVVEGKGRATMQAWGIVQNLSGEDWKDVRLSLVAGAPLAFEATLGTPSIPRRPTVTDEGEVIAAVPRGETTLAREEPKDASGLSGMAASGAAMTKADGAYDAPAEAEAALDDEEPAKRPSGAASKAEKAATRRPFAKPAPPPPPPSPSPVMVAPSRAATTPSAPRSLRSLAAISATGGVTRYDLPEAVTVPDKAATMVMLLSKELPGDAAFLFAPDGGVPDSYAHPFRVARFTNKTGGALERGPIAVFDRGAFLGQGMVEVLPEGATATVPFALDRALAVDRTTKRDELGERVQKIENAQLFVERDVVTQTLYRVKNGSDAPANLLVKHLRIAGARLEKPPVGTEDNVGTGSALVPTSLGARADGELVVDERVSVQREEPWTSPVADAAVRALLVRPDVDAAVKAALTQAWTLRTEIVHLSDVQRETQVELNELNAQSEETRRNLRSIEKNKIADKLRAQLTKRLEDLSKRTEEVGKKLVETQAKLTESNVRFRDLVRSIRWVAPPTTGTTSPKKP